MKKQYYNFTLYNNLHHIQLHSEAKISTKKKTFRKMVLVT